MSQQVTARLPDPVVDALDSAARQLRRSRADVIRQAVERYLQDFDDLSSAIQRLRDPGDPVLDWDRVRRELLDSDSAPPVRTGGAAGHFQETLAANGCSAFFCASTSSTVGLPATARSMASLVAW